MKTPLVKKSPKNSTSHPYKENGFSSIGPLRASSVNNESSIKARSIKWPENPLKPKPKEKKQGVIVDYLKELRSKH